MTLILSVSLVLSGIYEMYLGYLEYKGEYGYGHTYYSHKKYKLQGEKAKISGIVNMIKGLLLGCMLGLVLFYTLF